MHNSTVISRRAFLGGGFALVASAMCAPMRAFAASMADAAADAASPMPEYYKAYLAGVAAKVNDLARNAADAFWFITDLHITSNKRQSGKVIAALTGMTPIRKTICGGDLPEAFASRFESPKAGVDYAIDFYRLFWTDPIERSGQLMYTAKGNHDFTIRLNPTADDGFTYSETDAARIVMATGGAKGAVTNRDDPTACYYYFDNAKAKIRYIVADTTDTVDPKSKFWGVVYGMHDRQLKWLADNAVATIPDGWGAVVVHHIPITGITGTKGDANRFAQFRKLLEAYQNRGTVAICGKEYDFANARGRILLDLCGHEHAERQTFQNGILHVTDPCDACYGDYIVGSQPWCGELPRKVGGTVTEQTFDAVVLDTGHDRIHFVRVGGGQDRVIHLRPIALKVGDKLAFKAPLLSGALTWGCYDADHVDFVPNPKNKYCPLVKYFSECGGIDADGVFTAKKAGEMMVLGMDSNLNKEIFPVTIRG